MKNFKQMLLIAALLLSIGASAQSSGERITVVIQLDGTTVTTGGGAVSVNVSGNSAELTVTPAEGNYFETTDLTVMKHTVADIAQSRRRSAPAAPDYDETVSISADAGNTLTGASKFTFALDDDENILYRVTADFHARTSIATATVTVAAGPYTYNGTPHKPGVTVQLGTTTLDGSSDYTVDYADNTDAGTASVIVTGIGKYIGTNNTATFAIGPKSIAGVTVTLTPESFVFNRDNQKPAVTVSDGDNELVLDTDYTLTNEGGTNVGEYSVKVTGKGNYDSKTSVEKKYSITAKEITPVVTLANPDETFVYDGTEKKPAVKVCDDDFELSDTDYDIGYTDNVEAGENTATVTVTLKGNYSGNGSVSFTIGTAPMTVTAEGWSGTYDGGTHSISVTAPEEATITYGTAAGTYGLTENPEYKDAGKYEVFYQVTKKNYTTVEGSAEVVIEKAALTVTADDQSVAYGAEVPEYTAVYEGFVDGEDESVLGGTLVFECDYQKGSGKGSYTITPGGLTSDNYTVSFVSGTLTVGIQSLENAFIEYIESQVYNGQPQTPELNITYNGLQLVKDTDYTVRFANNINAGEADVYITGIGNFTGSFSTIFVISPKFLKPVWVRPVEDQQYTGTAITPGVVIMDGDKQLKENVDYVISYTDNIEVGVATAEVEGINNYYGKTIVQFNIVDAAATDIVNIKAGTTRDVWYDMHGRLLPEKPTRKGLYILNGKKVTIK